MHIRPATVADRAAVVGLGLQFATTMPAFLEILEGVSAESLGSLFDQLLGPLADRADILVAEDRGGEVFGCLALVELPHVMTGLPFAEEIAWWVQPDRRGQLAGVRLLTAAMDWTRARGLKRLKMGAPAGTRVGEFYESQGFCAVETAYLKVLA
jgi:GNAT superfamily N-acetyltransferase